MYCEILLLRNKIFSQTALCLAIFLVTRDNKSSLYYYHHRHYQQHYYYIENLHANNIFTASFNYCMCNRIITNLKQQKVCWGAVKALRHTYFVPMIYFVATLWLSQSQVGFFSLMRLATWGLTQTVVSLFYDWRKIHHCCLCFSLFKWGN